MFFVTGFSFHQHSKNGKRSYVLRRGASDLQARRQESWIIVETEPQSSVFHRVWATNYFHLLELTMKRTLLLSGLAALFLAAGAMAEDKPGQKKPGDAKRPPMGKFDGKGKGQLAEAMFKRLDADGDGKISKDEFKKFGENAPGGKLKDRPQVGEKMFERLDANSDGFISADEFKKLGEMLQDRKGGGKPGERPPIKKPGADK
jgi:hypothetical protein